MGQIRKRGEVWWIRYYRDGQRFEESARTDKKREGSRSAAAARRGDCQRRFYQCEDRSLRFEDAAADLVNDYKVNAKKTTADVDRRIKLHLKLYFRGRRMSTITTADVRAFVAERQK